MNYEAEFCVFAFVAFCAVMVYALYRRALNVDDAVRDDVESLPPQHINFRCTLQPIINIKNTSDDLLSRDDVLELAGGVKWDEASGSDIIADIDKAQSEHDGWIDWHGGECPVPDGTIVDVKYRCDEIGYKLPANEAHGYDADASYAFWRNDGIAYDIIAYRVCGQSARDHKHTGAVGAGDTCATVPERVQSVSNTSAPLPKGWQPWEGDSGWPPVAGNIRVFVMMRNGYIVGSHVADYFTWNNYNSAYDILAYRIAD